MDSSFCVGNENASFDVPSSASTPKKSQFVCPICDKKYVSKFYFEKHVASHGSDENASVATGNDLSLQERDVSFAELGGSTEKGVNLDKGFKKPLQKPKPKYKCTYCLKGYISKKSFDMHNIAHGIQDAASRFPDRVKLISNSEDMCMAALTTVSRLHSSGDMGEVFRSVIGYIVSICDTQEWIDFSRAVCDRLLRSIDNQKFILPSVLLSKLTDQNEIIQDDDNERSYLINLLKIPEMFNSASGIHFFVELCMNLVRQILSFIVRSVKPFDANATRPIPVIDAEDREVIYYIGGSILRGYFRIAKRHRSNKTWATVAEVLNSKAISDDPSKIKDASWTLAINRGGLIFISAECQEFFVALTKVVFTCEEPNGSINYVEVIRCVSNSDVCLLWDGMIEDELLEQQSLNLMNSVIKFFCQTCGRAFARKRLNFLRERPVISMTVRHMAASRKRKHE